MSKALFFDIDGTLVSFRTHMIPQSAVDAMTRIKQLGHKIFIATGRPKCIINNLGQIDHLIDGYVTTNGAFCFAGDRVIRQLTFLRQDIETIISDAIRKRYPAIVVSNDCMRVINNNSAVDEIFVNELNIRNLDYSTPLEQVLRGSVIQITPFIGRIREKCLVSRLRDTVSGRWHKAFIDLTPRGADKGSGILAMADFFGISQSDTIAFGDGGNDIPMLRAAGIGVAMGNAGIKTQQAAGLVTASVDDNGVAIALQQLGMI